MRAGLGMRGSRSRAPEPGVRDARLAHLPAARCSGSPSPWGFLVSQGSRGRERTPGPRAPGALSTRQVFFKSFEAHWEQRPGARERQCDLTEAGTVRKVPRRPPTPSSPEDPGASPSPPSPSPPVQRPHPEPWKFEAGPTPSQQRSRRSWSRGTACCRASVEREGRGRHRKAPPDPSPSLACHPLLTPISELLGVDSTLLCEWA